MKLFECPHCGSMFSEAVDDRCPHCNHRTVNLAGVAVIGSVLLAIVLGLWLWPAITVVLLAVVMLACFLLVCR